MKIGKDGEEDGEEEVVEGEGDEGGGDDWRTACRYWYTTGVGRGKSSSLLQEIARKSSEEMREEEATRRTN